MAYSSQELVRLFYPREDLARMAWLIDNLEGYSVQKSSYCGWQFCIRNRYFTKKSQGWIEVDECGKVLLHCLVA